MHISKLQILNYRQIGQVPLVIDFKSGLNILIGENNIGKTTVIEAVALVLGYGSAERSAVAIQTSDFHDKSLPIEIHLEFSDLSDEQESSFIEALDVSGASSVLRFQFRFNIKETKIIAEITCGQHGTTRNPYDLLAHLNCHYLKALRDVSQEFKPGSRNRLGKILNKLFLKVTEEDRVAFEGIFRDAEKNAVDFAPSQPGGEDSNESAAEEDADKAVGPIKQLESKSNELIEKLQFAGDDNSIVLGIHERELMDILYTVFPRAGNNNLDLALNGLGYNNLIYVAVLLTEIESLTGTADFICLLIEEPEAHLHPQLQRLLLDFLRTEYKHVQVVLSSHSPAFVADSKLEDLILVSRNDGGELVGIGFSALGLTDEAKRFLRKFLDVTKSQLLFARIVIFVEGYTEAMLFRAFWDEYFASDDMKFYKASIEVVNIAGIGFKHYIELVGKVFTKTHTRCVVITDDDRGTGKGVDDNQKLDASKSVDDLLAAWPSAKPSATFDTIAADVTALRSRGCKVELFEAQRTFEVEFGLANPSHKLVIEDVSTKSKTADIAANGEDVLKNALALWKKVADQKTNFALEILKALEEEPEASRPKPPGHFVRAFKYLKNGDASVEDSNS